MISPHVLIDPPAPDWTALAELHAAAFGARGERGWSAAEIRDLAQAPVGKLFVLETKTVDDHPRCGQTSHRNSIVGFLLASWVAPEMEILTFAIAPNQQNKGFGGVLLATLRDQVENKCGGQIRLEVGSSNVSAISLYQRFGFGIDYIRKGYYKKDTTFDSGLCMRLEVKDRD